MKVKKIIVLSKNDDILYKVTLLIYNLGEMTPKKILIINQNKAVIYFNEYKRKRTLKSYLPKEV